MNDINKYYIDLPIYQICCHCCIIKFINCYDCKDFLFNELLYSKYKTGENLLFKNKFYEVFDNYGIII